jgi:transposase-like protein
MIDFSPDGSAVLVELYGSDEHGEIVAELHAETASSRLAGVGRVLQEIAALLLDGADVDARDTSSSRRGRRWTAGEIARLVQLAQEGASPVELARELGRGEAAIRWKLWGQGLGPRPEVTPASPSSDRPRAEPSYRLADLRRVHPHSHRPWGPEDEHRLLERFGQGVTLPELAQEFGRTEGAITARLQRLGAIEPPS